MGTRTFCVEHASTRPERRYGEMYRTRIGRDGGMLFAWSHTTRRPFWLVRCATPLDILFVAGSPAALACGQGRIVRIVTVPPESDAIIRSGAPVQAAIELRAGHRRAAWAAGGVW